MLHVEKDSGGYNAATTEKRTYQISRVLVLCHFVLVLVASFREPLDDGCW